MLLLISHTACMCLFHNHNVIVVFLVAAFQLLFVLLFIFLSEM